MKMIKTKDVKTDPKFQLRAKFSEEYADELFEVIKSNGTLPPIVIATWGKGESATVDGFHRLWAYKKANRREIPAEIREVKDATEALSLALAANASHGLRRTKADKRKAVLAAFNGFGRKKSNRWIADSVKVSHTFVANVRKETGKGPDRTEGKDGKTRDATRPSGNNGTAPATVPPPGPIYTTKMEAMTWEQRAKELAKWLQDLAPQVHRVKDGASALQLAQFVISKNG